MENSTYIAIVINSVSSIILFIMKIFGYTDSSWALVLFPVLSLAFVLIVRKLVLYLIDKKIDMENEFQYILSMVEQCEHKKLVSIPTYLSYVKRRLKYFGYTYTEFNGVLTIHTGK